MLGDRTSVIHSRAPHGARGLKHTDLESPNKMDGRAPHGARGLKLTLSLSVLQDRRLAGSGRVNSAIRAFL